MSEPATSMAAGRAAAPIVADAAGAAAAAAPMRADLAQLKDDRKLLKQTLKQVSKSIKNEDPGCTATLDFRFQLRWMDAFIPFWNSLPSSIKRHSSEIYNYAIILGGRCTQTLRSRYVYNSIVRISFLHVYVYIQYLVTIYIYTYVYWYIQGELQLFLYIFVCGALKKLTSTRFLLAHVQLNFSILWCSQIWENCLSFLTRDKGCMIRCHCEERKRRRLLARAGKLSGADLTWLLQRVHGRGGP